MMSRILYAAFDIVPSPKGASTHITYFARGLVEAGYELTLITAGDPALAERDIYFGAELLRAPAGDDPNFLQRAMAFGEYALAQVTAAKAYAVVHVRSVWSGFPLAEQKERFGYKLLYEVNGLPSIEMKYHYPALRGTAVLDKIRERELATLYLADAIICPSRVTAAYITSLGIPETKITVIPNGIDPQLFQAECSPLLDRPDPIPTILYLGTLADWQGLETLIAALPPVLAKREAQLQLVGPGRKRQRKLLQKHVQKLGVADYVTIEPPVPHHQVPALIGQAAVGIAPLGYNDRNVTQGCCPIKILEYMACGRPVVASNLPVVRELICPEVQGLLFNPDDPSDLAEKILTVLDNPDLANRLGSQAASRAHQQFTWRTAQLSLLKVYQGLLS